MKMPIFLLLMLSMVMPVITGGCSRTHETMRSTIVMKLEKEAHVCIGASDGVKLGDILTVYRTKRIPSPKQTIVPDRSGRYQPKMQYEMVKVGIARVTALLGEHYAAIEPIDIDLEASDIIEKTSRE